MIDTNAFATYQPPPALAEPILHCLTCGGRVRDSVYDLNNGTCDECPRLARISDVFWTRLSNLAANADPETRQLAQDTFRIYGESQ